MTEGDLIDVFGAGQLQENQRDRGQLGEDGGQRNAHNAHPEPYDKKQIEDDIDNAGNDQIEEGMAGVADGAEDTRADIVDGRKEDTGQIDAQIGGRFGIDIGRTADHIQQQRCADNAQSGHAEAEDEGKAEGGVDGVVEALVGLGAEITGQQYAAAGGQTGEKADQQLGDIRAGRNGSQRGGADITADNDGVDAVVEILKDLTCQNGQCKDDDQPDDVALGHIHTASAAGSGGCCHRNTPLFLIV